ncbi:uncharacterized protein [Procambarus clarkii]|uniref:uncharacterized protein n=1 Tax=Procambarus clarkii TaxID=6728 RepID=UPI003743EF75
MKRFSWVSRRSRSCDARLSSRVLSAASLNRLLQHLAHNTTLNTMGNNVSDPSSQSPPQKGFQWSSGSSRAYGEPPEVIVKLAKILVGKSLTEDNIDGISENVFLKYVCKASQPLGKRLFQYSITHWQKSEQESIPGVLSKAAFLSSANCLLALMTDSQQLEFYIKVFARHEEKIEKQDVYELIFAAYQISTASQRTCCMPDDILMSVVNSAMHGKESVNTKYLHSWVCHHCPRLVMWLHRYITHILTVGHRTIPDNTEEKEADQDTPILDCPSKTSCVTLHPALIWLLTGSLPTIYTKQQKKNNLPSSNNLLMDPHVFISRMISAVSPTHWMQLYNSDNHGLSINRLQHHVFGYNSPTMMFITAEGGNLFCLASDVGWRDSKHFWGGENCLCMQLTPEYKIIESGPKIMYFNVTSRGFPTGIQVGLDNTNRALTLDLNLSLITYRKIPFKLHVIEVWGCGTCEAKEAQTELKKREVKDVENRRKVKLNSSDWLDNPDRYLIELAGTRVSYAQYDSPPPEKDSSKS